MNKGKANGGRRGAFPPYGLQGRTKTETLLGVSRVTLWKRLKEYKVQVETVVRG